MYRFQVSAVTQPGESIALIGSISAMGEWHETRCLPLCTSGDRYPLWWVDVDVQDGAVQSAEYKYVKIRSNGQVEWEAWGVNRWVPIESGPLPSTIVVEDGRFGTIPVAPNGYFAEPVLQPTMPLHPGGLKIVVIGSSVALGCSAWLLRGWAWHLGQILGQKYGHQLVNVSVIGANVGSTIARFSQVVLPEKPDIVIIALSLGNEGLAVSAPQHQRAIQRRFEAGLQQLVKMTQAAGAMPILGAVYPHGNYNTEHDRLLKETHQRMLSWGVPVLDWLGVLEDGGGRWREGLAADPAHPNTEGQEQMYGAIDLSIFPATKSALIIQPPLPPTGDRVLYQDADEFTIALQDKDSSLQISNHSSNSYTITPTWEECQCGIQSANLPTGLYVAQAPTTGAVSSLFVQDDGRIGSWLTIAPSIDLTFYPAFHFFDHQRFQIIFQDGDLRVLQDRDRYLYLINASDHEYNVHPMWRAVRSALQALPAGVYEDLDHADVEFRTMMIDADGLASRVKIAARSVIRLSYKCSLAERSRVAIMPLGDRCAARMLLYKLGYDGPAFPFDLTRTTSLADVADIIQSGFEDMWNPDYLQYNAEEKRIYHKKWAHLSFAHEVEDDEDPLHDMTPVYDRMRTRYSARAQRFGYTLENCDKVLFVRTGGCDRASLIDFVEKLERICQGKPFWLLLVSPQSSEEFAGIPHLLHYDLMFNPDSMYADLGHWQYCAELMREMLNGLGISSRNLFWCPPKLAD